MHAVMLGMAMGLVGVNTGWRVLPEGGVEFILQIAPTELDLFKSEKEVVCDVRPELGQVRVFRVIVGNYVLPRQNPPQAPPTSAPSAKPTWTGWAGSPNPLRDFLLRTTTRLWDPGAYRPVPVPSAPAKRPQETKAVPSSVSADRKAPAATDHATRPQPQPDKKQPAPPSPLLPTKPWMPFTVAVVAFFGSFGGNLYLLWILGETRARYRALLHRHMRSRHRPEKTRDELPAYES